MTEVPLPALEGTNPLGFLAALGVLDIAAAAVPGAALRWAGDLVPHAIITGPAGVAALLDALEEDRQEWARSALLRFPEGRAPLADAKPGREQLRQWFEFVASPGREADASHLCAIVAEDALDRNARAKPTHLHFTAGQQQFLRMVRELAGGVDRGRLLEAIRGPWRYDSHLPALSWDPRGERVYALRGVNPSRQPRFGVPGADWLAFRGLVFYPVARTACGSLRTTACDAAWRRSAFRWPLWTVPVTRNVARSLVADPALVAKGAEHDPAVLAARGVWAVCESRIRRADQSGYGSFSPAEILATASPGMLKVQ